MAQRVDVPGEVGCKSHFLDSGSFSLMKAAAEYHKKTGKGEFAYYETEEFWDYVDAYCDFVRKYKIAIDLYSVVDVIPEPRLTWRVQRYMEGEQGLHPVPVVHYRSDLRWLTHYASRGHSLISLGGLVGSSGDEEARRWLDAAFKMVCTGPDFLPTVKLHGFGMTSFDMMVKYPWYSVDSATWTKVAAFGGILVPQKRGGRFVYIEEPYICKISWDSPERKKYGKHYLTCTGPERKLVDEWLDEIQVPLGELDADGDPKTWGVLTRHSERRLANILFFEAMRKSLPPYPWSWRPRRIQTGGLLQL